MRAGDVEIKKVVEKAVKERMALYLKALEKKAPTPLPSKKPAAKQKEKPKALSK